MALNGLRVVIDDHHRNALLLDARHVGAQRFKLPVSQHQQIRVQAQHFFYRETLRFNFAHVRDVFQRRTVCNVHLPVCRHPAFPRFA